MSCLLLTTEFNRAAVVVIKIFDKFRCLFIAHFNALLPSDLKKLVDTDASWILGEKSELNETLTNPHTVIVDVL